MKTFFLALFALLSLSMTAQAAFQSQTLYRLANGSIQTLPSITVDPYNIGTLENPQLVTNSGLIYDQAVTMNATFTAMGGNYAFTSDGKLLLVSENGSFYPIKLDAKTNYQPADFNGQPAIGGNYFFNKDTNEIIAIDSTGCHLRTGMTAANVRLMGGNFFISQVATADGKEMGVLTTIKHMGQTACNNLGIVTVKEGIDFSGAVKAGGNFFLQIDGTIVGVSSDYGFYTLPQKVDSAPKYIGGNYYIGQDDVLYTVTDQGEVKKNSPIIGKIKTFGYSYLIAEDDYLIFIDGKGVPHTEMVKVFQTGKASKVEKFGAMAKPAAASFIKAEQYIEAGK